MRSRHVVLCLAALVVLTTTGLRLASAAIRDAIAHCCCGDHALHEDCHCPRCPADDRDHRGPEQTTLERCHVEGSSPLTVMLPVFERAPTIVIVAPARLAPRHHALAIPIQGPTPRPPHEPPR